MTDTRVSELFGARLKTLRQRMKLSQSELARRLDISKAIVARWERGETSPTLDKVNRVAEFFQLSLSELIAEGLDETAALRAAENLLKQWTPAFTAIKQAVQAAANKEEKT